MKYSKISLIVIVVCLSTILSGIELTIEKVSSNFFPNVDVYVKTADFKESKDIDFEIYEDGVLVPFEDVSLISKDIHKKLDILFILDVSRENFNYLDSIRLSMNYFLKELIKNGTQVFLNLGIYGNDLNLITSTNELETFLRALNDSTRRARRVRNRIGLVKLLLRVLEKLEFKNDYQKLIVIIGDPKYDPEGEDSGENIEKLKNALNLRNIELVFYSKEPDNYKKLALATNGAVYDLKLTDDMTRLNTEIKNIYEERFKIRYSSPAGISDALKTHELKIRWLSSNGWIEKRLTYKEPTKIALGIENVVKVKGLGAPRPDFKDPYRKFLSARDAAIINAREQLLETVKGVQISSNKTLGEMMVEDYIIDKNIRGFLLGAKITNESWDPKSETYMVEMAINLTGPNGLMGELESLNRLRDNILGVSKDSNVSLRYIDKYGFTDSLIYAEGYGLAKPTSYKAISIQNARRVAIMEAQKELLAILKGISLVGNTFASNHMIVETKIREYLNGILKGAEIIEEKLIAEPTESDFGLYKVKMAVRWDERVGIQKEIADILKDLKPGEIYIGNSSIGQENNKKLYTGLIIDATGLGLKPILFPEILTEDGKKIYSFEVVDDDYRRKYSIVEYHKTLSDALKSHRVGDNPLIIGAKAVKDGFKIIIDDSVLDKLTESLGTYDFLKEGKVILVGN